MRLDKGKGGGRHGWGGSRPPRGCCKDSAVREESRYKHFTQEIVELGINTVHSSNSILTIQFDICLICFKNAGVKVKKLVSLQAKQIIKGHLQYTLFSFPPKKKCIYIIIYIWYKSLGKRIRVTYHIKGHIHSEPTASSSSSHEVNFSLGLFLKLPNLFSSLSILSQALKGTTRTFLSSKIRRSPSLPSFGELVVDAKTPRSRSSDKLATYNHNGAVSKDMQVG